MYIQTWHGTPLKRLANDMKVVRMPGTTTANYKKNFYAEASRWDKRYHQIDTLLIFLNLHFGWMKTVFGRLVIREMMY